jgi:ferric-dicitrate binding protein FerR (iron transport regulator)
MLSYQFSRRKRLLELKGEAYFKVSRDVQRPFSIQTGNVSTTVLGTTFNVEAFPEDNRVEVSLVSGKVEVRIAGKGSTRSWSLSPGEQLQYLSQGEKVEKSVFNPQNETAWKGGQVVLVKTPLPTALHQISRFYNTALRFDTMNLKKCSVTSTFDQSNSIEEVLMVVLFSNNLTFKKHGNGYVIEGSGCDQ